jgi:transposase-like protein
MNDGVRRIRRKIARLKQERHPTAVRYPVALQRKVIALARRRQARGTRIAALARELGLAEWTVSLWLRQSAMPVLRAVEIAPVPPAPVVAAPVLITPQGIRIEGATVEALAALLRALR